MRFFRYGSRVGTDRRGNRARFEQILVMRFPSQPPKQKRRREGISSADGILNDSWNSWLLYNSTRRREHSAVRPSSHDDKVDLLRAVQLVEQGVGF